MRFIKLETIRVNVESIRKYEPFKSAIAFHVDDEGILLQFKSIEHRDEALKLLDIFLSDEGLGNALDLKLYGAVREVRSDTRSKLKEL